MSLRRKHFFRTMGILLASAMVLTTGSQYAIGAEVTSDTVEVSSQNTEEGKEEGMIVYLNGKSGKNKRSGQSKKKAVKSFKKAAELVGEYGIIYICGTVTVKTDQTWELPAGVSVRRAEGFDGPLVRVYGELTLENVLLYTDDMEIMDGGSVEGAREREKVHIPAEIEIEEPAVLSEIPLSECYGDGVFAWEKEDLELTEYETVCNVVFYPYDTEAVNYTEEKGWNEENQVVVREVTLYVSSLKPQDEESGEPTPEPTPEATPEATPEVTQEPTKESTPEPTQAPTPEAAPEITLEVTQEPTKEPTSETTPEVTPETTPEVTPEVQPEVTPVPDEKTESLTEEQLAEVENVKNLITYLPEEINSQEAIEAILDVTKALEALTEEQRELITDTDKEKLWQAQETAKVFLRTCNGVTIEGNIPWYVQLKVELQNDKSEMAVLEAQNLDTFITPYDITLWDLMKNEEYLLVNQQVKVTVPMPDTALYNQLVIIHYLEDNTVEYITPIDNHDGTMSFITTSFSPYSIAGNKVLVGNTDKLYGGTTSSNNGSTSGNKNSTSGSSSSGSNKTTVSNKNSSGSSGKTSGVSTWVPNTGDQAPIFLYIGIAAAAVVILFVAVWKMKKKK